MRKRLVTLANSLEGTAPSEVRIFAPGPLETTKGTFHFTARSARLVMEEAADYGNRRSADYEHQALAYPPVEAPAAAWYDLELRTTDAGPELWAVNIEWTENARQRIEAGEYRYISPTFYTDPATGEILAFINFALTNLPATKAMDALIAASRVAGRSVIDAAQALGVSIDQVMDQLLAQISAVHFTGAWPVELFTDAIVVVNDNTGQYFRFTYRLEGETPELTGGPTLVERQWVEKGEDMKGALRALGLQEAASEDAAIAAIEGLRADHATVEKLRTIIPEGDLVGTITALRDKAARVDALEAQVAQQAEADRAARVEALVTQGLSERKLTPGNKDAILEVLKDENGLVQPERLDAYLKAAAPVVASAGAREPSGGGQATPSVDTKGKAWADLSNMERHQLRLTNPDEFQRLYQAHKQSLS